MSKRTKGRANGEGSIYEYPKGSGDWFAQIYLEDGRSKRHRAASQREAREKLRQLQAELAHRLNLTIQQPTVAEGLSQQLRRDGAGITHTITHTPSKKHPAPSVEKRGIPHPTAGAGDGTRTRTGLPPTVFKTVASAVPPLRPGAMGL
jgi:hypothetical protein